MEETSSSSSVSSTAAPALPRDEVKEVQHNSRHDTRRIRWWRMVVAGMIGTTAVAVTVGTYVFLDRQETENFENAFDQFSKSLQSAALEQQRQVREAMTSLATTVTASAATTHQNTSWPYYALPAFESFGKNILVQSSMEIIAVINRVSREERASFEEFIDENVNEWVHESHRLTPGFPLEPVGWDGSLKIRNASGWVPDDERDEYWAMVSVSPPVPTLHLIGWSHATVEDYADVIRATEALSNETCLTRIRSFAGLSREAHNLLHSRAKDGNVVAEHPHSFAGRAVHAVVGDDSSSVVAFLSGAVAWDTSMRNLLPETVQGLICVIRNSCGDVFTYQVDGKEAYFLGNDDYHDASYDGVKLALEVDFSETYNDPNAARAQDGHCIYSMVSNSNDSAIETHAWYQTIYPSKEFESLYHGRSPVVLALLVALAFVLMMLVFFVYDGFVQRRNSRLVQNAARSNAIVTSLFPGNIRDRLIGSSDDTNEEESKNLTSFMNRNKTKSGKSTLMDTYSKPLADLFLECTVIFADIVGFTAWSSVREPSQVFTLLENIYRAFDEIAAKRCIYKVETVGDCYVAVTGLPEQRADHAVAMVKFAESILKRMGEVTKELEVILGPDTSNLCLRIGIHSGPITAGVLRGERARFQLFGGTVNTCARMESTGSPGRIHISKETAKLITKFGKEHWLEERADAVAAKGKGLLQTYWVNFGFTAEESDASEGQVKASKEQHRERLIDWNATVLLDILREIVVKRGDEASKVVTTSNDIAKKATPLEEVKEIIELPKFKAGAADMTKVTLSQEVVDEVHDFVKRIASMYLDNPFHCFDHASHVVMSVTKLLGRIVAPKESDLGLQEQANLMDVAVTLHDHTYGITSDPLTQFACAFSALIHDVDHQGIPNPQLCKEKPALATMYNQRSVAEQNSLDLSWDLLMQDEFAHFRSVLCATKHDLQHFRNLVVNSVMATDIMDKELKELRNSRWQRAFDSNDNTGNSVEAVNRKATIVIEHLIQASDVSHTMQHWHIYRKWNQRLFHEMHQAYKDGRADKDPSEFWYKGEIGFFDFYIIPLAKKLKDCGVFGVSSDEFLSYALQNRNEWEERGQGIVAEMMQELQAVAPTSN